MSTLTGQPLSASYARGRVFVKMRSGLDFGFLVVGNPRPEAQVAAKLAVIESSPFGPHWPLLDEDLSIRGVLNDNHGILPARHVRPKPKVRATTPAR
ncbi:MAG: hypothetical protein HS117_15390 [Verrucomicrobiaceae bacterium]|jgi:hypothetical protein|nr:hypothetical protein [Verrucomicrobiaceae bacterium]